MYTGSLPQVSNRETWSLSVTVTDPETDTAVDLTGATITIALREPEMRQPRMSFTSGDGMLAITAPATSGIFTLAVPPQTMAQLGAGQYEVGVRVALASGTKRQLIVATMAVVEGIVDP